MEKKSGQRSVIHSPHPLEVSVTFQNLQVFYSSRRGTFMSWGLALRKCHSCPFPFYLCSIKNTQCNQKFFKIVLLGFLAYCHETASLYFIIFFLLLLLLFFLIQSWPWPQFLMSELKQWKGLHSILSFPVLSSHISMYLWLKHSSAASHHTLPNHRVEALLWLGCKLLSANNSWHMSCLSFTMTLLQSLSVWKHLHETWLDLKTYKFPNAE